MIEQNKEKTIKILIRLNKNFTYFIKNGKPMNIKQMKQFNELLNNCKDLVDPDEKIRDRINFEESFLG